MVHASGDREVRYHVLMVRFDGAETASTMLARLEHDPGFEGFEIEGASAIWRDARGGIHVHERGGAGWGAAFGTAAAGIVGFVTGPVALPILLVVGALAGGVAGHFAGRMIPGADLRRAAAALRANDSALIAIVDTQHAARVADGFREEGELLLDEPLETELSNAIREAVLHEVRRG